jgi:hypothetical protein
MLATEATILAGCWSSPEAVGWPSELSALPSPDAVNTPAAESGASSAVQKPQPPATVDWTDAALARLLNFDAGIVLGTGGCREYAVAERETGRAVPSAVKSCDTPGIRSAPPLPSEPPAPPLTQKLAFRTQPRSNDPMCGDDLMLSGGRTLPQRYPYTS